MTTVFTICSNNYLAQAITLGNSLINYNPNYQFCICLVDRTTEKINYTKIPYEIIEVENINISNFEDLVSKYDITELNTAVKPYFFQYFFNKKTETVIYLDPDILIFNSFSELEKELKTNEIVITPHFTSIIDDDKWQAEEDFLNSGLYNLGFIAIKNTQTGNEMVNWWSLRLRNKAFIDLKRGLFTDQIWINFVPLFFNNVKILIDPGYNMAYWNMHERLLESNKVFKNGNKSSLVFFHFSGYNPLNPNILSKYQNRFTFENRIDVRDIFTKYRNMLFANNYAELISIPCYYTVEKQKNELALHLTNKNKIPITNRIIRGIILRLIKLFKINIEYYTK